MQLYDPCNPAKIAKPATTMTANRPALYKSQRARLSRSPFSQSTISFLVGIFILISYADVAYGCPAQASRVFDYYSRHCGACCRGYHV